MGAGHAHATPQAWAGERHRRPLWLAFGMLAVYMVVQAVAAWLTGSLALLSDAGHMFTDVLGIGMALAAIIAAGRASNDPQRTFGLYRLEVLAALANAVLLSGVAIFVLVESVRRFDDPPEVAAGPMLVVAVGGLAVNVVAFLLLRSGAKESINLRGAYLEVLGDLLGSVGVIIAASVIATTGWRYADPIVAVVVGLLILPRTWKLALAAGRVLVQAAPAHVEVALVRERLAGLDGVTEVHDLHVWTLTSGMEVASAHLNLGEGADVAAVLAAARRHLHDDFGIEHATLQVEPPSAERLCHGTSW
ncbi:cation diffusion facilitator family transporter [Plantactinospora soyae]|uniref:Cobalt-zinc-cadmium efflux system protein n=1 Tax=Plantactinospora soyae TaxID=1544732 RepID=A0A927QWJ2_9ACTN|nr:cation diffusion facilitator family transporter [Plantactinospora soyae]MBE1484498.1 cobalt-zinc-cadmium efflux system protein [Plantactinospora soyae]